MSLELLGYIELPENIKPGGFDHAAVHCGSGRLYVAHTANDCLDVIDCVYDRYLHSILKLAGVAGALVSDEHNLVFTSNRGENTVGIFAPDNEAGLAKVGVGIRPNGYILFGTRLICMFAYGFLSVVLVLYLAQLGLNEGLAKGQIRRRR